MQEAEKSYLFQPDVATHQSLVLYKFCRKFKISLGGEWWRRTSKCYYRRPLLTNSHTVKEERLTLARDTWVSLIWLTIHSTKSSYCAFSNYTVLEITRYLTDICSSLSCSLNFLAFYLITFEDENTSNSTLEYSHCTMSCKPCSVRTQQMLNVFSLKWRLN